MRHSVPTREEIHAEIERHRLAVNEDNRGSAARPSPFDPTNAPAAASDVAAELSRLVALHGRDAVARALANVADPSPRKSARYAVSYEGRLVKETAGAILWWIPDPKDATGLDGQAAWIPRVVVISAIDQARRAHPCDPPPALGVLTTTKPVEWSYASNYGGSIRWHKAKRSA